MFEKSIKLAKKTVYRMYNSKYVTKFFLNRISYYTLVIVRSLHTLV